MTATGTPDWVAMQAELDELTASGGWFLGPSTVLGVLDRGHLEISHQRMIAWLLDPSGAHGLGASVLDGLLAHVGRPPSGPCAPGGITVRTEVVRANSRADIVITTPHLTLVIELKVHADEGDQQTSRLADDYAATVHTGRQLALLYLTLDHGKPADPRFDPVGLADFTLVLRHALTAAPPAGTPQAVRGRHSAEDYLDTIERMTGMAAPDMAAARIGFRFGAHLQAAHQAARSVLELLPAAVAATLAERAATAPEDLVVVGPFPYQAEGKHGSSFDELGVLLARPHWVDPDSGLRAGVGLGQRKKPDPFERDRRPFVGIRVEGPEAAFDHFLTHCPKWENGSWDWWPRWELLELDFPVEASGLLDTFAQRAADRILDLFRQYAPLVDESLAARTTPGTVN